MKALYILPIIIAVLVIVLVVKGDVRHIANNSFPLPVSGATASSPMTTHAPAGLQDARVQETAVKVLPYNRIRVP